MDKKQDKRKSNIANIKEQLSQGKTTALQDGVFIFHGPLTISEFAEKIKKELETLDLSHIFNGEKIFLSMSLGVVLFPQHGKIYTDIVTRCSGMPLIGRQRGGSMILFPEDI